MTIEELQKQAIRMLQEENMEEAVIKVKLLLAFVLQQPKEYLLIHSQEEVQKQVEKCFWKGVEKLKQAFPLAYVTHQKEFMGLNFYVDENVLIPRPDTEVLVETVLKRCKEESRKHILDLCTGSGAIAISLAKYLPESKVCGSDISQGAIEIAKKNAQSNKVKVNFYQSDLFKQLKGKWNVIVSNPPYIETEVIETLQPEVQKEPKQALDGGEDGLIFYRRIIEEAPKYLEQEGLLALEIGYQQAESVVALLEQTESYTSIEVKKDFAGNNREVIALKKTKMS